MKKIFLTFFLLVCTAVAAHASDWYQAYDYENYQLMTVNYCKESISLRKDASLSADTNVSIPLGEKLIVLDGRETNEFVKVNYRGAEGYVLKGYLESEATALRVANCEEWVSFRKQPDADSERIAKAPLGQLLYSSYHADGYASTMLMDYGYGYIPEKNLVRADEGVGFKRYVANCGDYAELHRYATTGSETIARIPSGEAVMCYSLNDAGMVYVHYKGDLWGFIKAKHLDLVPGENRLVCATLAIASLENPVLQTITDPDSLKALNELLAKAEPGYVGKCPMGALLTLELSDGTVLEYIYPIDGCSSLVGEDSRVYCIPSNINDRFWELFDSACAQLYI